MEDNTSTAKILIVDDNPKNIQVVGNILSENKFQIGFALSGQKAIEILNNSPDYDLILLDINMPSMNGFETCEILRNDPKFADLPIIFLTALNDSDDIVKGFKSGAQDYISKPFNASELVARVKTHIELKQSKDRLRDINKWLNDKVNEKTIELQNANKKLELQNRELEELDETKSEFLKIISHEIRTPLNGIIGFIDILKDELNNTELGEFLKYLDISAKRLERFANISLYITDLKTKRVNIPYEYINIYDTIINIKGRMDYIIIDKNLTFNLDNLDKDLSIYGVKIYIIACLESIINNAANYTKQNTAISIFTETNEEEISIRIQDQGPGFNEKSQKSLFKLFSSGQPHIDKSEGLGLAMAKLIMNLHNGSITANNLIQGGAEITLKLSIKNQQQ